MGKSSSKLKLTKVVVDSLDCPQVGQRIIYDSELPGFGIRLTRNAKSYIAQAFVAGKSVRVTIGAHGPLTTEEARREARKKLGDMERGINLNHEKRLALLKSMTLQDLHSQFMSERGVSLRPATVKLYEGAIRRCFQDWLQVPINEIDKNMIERRHLELSNANGPRGKGESHANQSMRYLRTLFNYAIASEILQVNPVKRLSDKKLWNKNIRRKTLISKTDLPRWYQGVMELRNETIRDYLLLMLFTGLRRTEAAQLEWSNVDFANKTLTISSEITKNHEEHQIPLSSFVEHLLVRRKAYLVPSEVYVFPGDGKNKHLIESKYSIGLVIQATGIEFSPHDLRRTFLTILESLDVSPYTIKRLANHKMASDVTAGYIVSDIDRLRKPMQQVCDLIMQYAGLTNQSLEA